MKATGIVRRVDDLGRIVIPKEVRRQLKIMEGTPMELFIDDDKVVFQKYDYAVNFKEHLNGLKESLADIRNEIGESKASDIASRISILEELINQ